MRILIVGAGATGGAFGARLLAAGRDVTFLVRPGRAAQLRIGLHYVTPGIDEVRRLRTVTADELDETFDLVIIAVKANALGAVIDDMRPAVGPSTVVLPILNGMAHMDRLERAFPGRVIGGIARIVATLDSSGGVRQLGELAEITVPADQPGVAAALDVPGIDLVTSDDILRAQWAKWTFIAAAGTVCCLFRGPVGAIVEAGGRPHIETIVAETEAVAAAAGYRVDDDAHRRSLATLTREGSDFTSSLYRDLVDGHPTEGEHLLGDLVARAAALDVPTPLTALALVQLRTATHHPNP
ncbi:2-dehydropantoate 2-reductase [Gordonia sp. FQ]|uniref:2-dehydropantoate 2-reductase n=1 Tax=Gordonia sp. FQ TaxID=3446634 RepID=UPI003F86B293